MVNIPTPPISSMEAHPPLDILLALELAQRKLHMIMGFYLSRAKCPLDVVSALILYRMGTKKLRPTDVKSARVYIGSNASYQIKKLVDGGYAVQSDNDRDGRSVYYELTKKGLDISALVSTVLAQTEQLVCEGTDTERGEIGRCLSVLDEISELRIRGVHEN